MVYYRNHRIVVLAMKVPKFQLYGGSLYYTINGDDMERIPYSETKLVLSSFTQDAHQVPVIVYNDIGYGYFDITFTLQGLWFIYNNQELFEKYFAIDN